MNRNEFGQLVAALRREHIDDEGSSWKQLDLANEAGLTEAMIGKIERGEKVLLDAQILLNLAQALQLTSRERKEFFLAASGVNNERLIHENSQPGLALNELVHLLEQLQAPAFLINVFGDILYLNPLFLAAFQFEANDFNNSEPRSSVSFNIMRLFFDPKFALQRQMMRWEAWNEFADRIMGLFRINTFHYRANPHWRSVLEELLKYPLFQQKWYTVHFREEDWVVDYTYLSLHHTEHGLLRCCLDPITAVTTSGDLRLYTLQPLNLDTTAAFTNMVRRYGTKPIRLAPWSNK
jgi:transcriptional regulator with XRE-family HTH domain